MFFGMCFRLQKATGTQNPRSGSSAAYTGHSSDLLAQHLLLGLALSIPTNFRAEG